MDCLQIQYIKLHFSLEIIEYGHLPRSKVSVLRGEMGHALLAANCIRDEQCIGCDFEEDIQVTAENCVEKIMAHDPQA